MARKFKPRVPQLAEGALKPLCDEIGAVANKVEDDQHGWDYVVDLPALESDSPVDRQSPGGRCYIQIKSSQGRSPSSCSLKLSNALRFAHSPEPCFVAYFIFDDGALRPTRFYVRHFWTDLLRETLERARRADAAGSAALNRLRLPIQFGPEQEVGENLMRSIIQEIDLIGENYAKKKIHLLQTLGYEDGIGSAHLTFAPDVTDEQIVDLNLGLIPDLKVNRLVAFDERFGIAARNPIVDQTDVTISVDPKPVDTCSITMHPVGSVEEISLEAEVFSPGIPGISEDLKKLRFKTEFFQLVHKPSGAADVSVRFDNTVPMLLISIQDLAQMFVWFKNGPVEVEVWTKGRVALNGTASLDARWSSAVWERVLAAVKLFGKLAPEARRPQKFKLAVWSLVQSLDRLDIFEDMVFAEKAEFAAEFPENSPFIENVSAVIGVQCFEIEKFTLYAFVKRPILARAVDGNKSVFGLGAPEVVRSGFIEGARIDNQEFLVATANTLSRADPSCAVTVVDP